jgi:hypothetical protein
MKGRYRKTPRRAGRSTVVALIVIDNGPLQEAAWSRLLLARKRLARAAGDLHRHEQEDEPAYRAWIHAACPALLSQIRELAFECEAKRKAMQDVQQQAMLRGTTPAVIWQQRKTQGELSQAFAADPDLDEGEPYDDDDGFGGPPDLEEIVDEILRDRGIDPDSPEAEMVRDSVAASMEGEDPQAKTAKEIYRRLVQRLHPDRGGVWNEQRARLWHEVQLAWQQRDHDWLSRLEAELDVVAEILGPQSSLGRLKAALAEIEAARRDTERKLRFYRKSPAWKFTAQPPSDADLRALERSLREEREHLRRTLAHLEAVIAEWEKPLGLSRSKKRVAPGRRSIEEQLNLL